MNQPTAAAFGKFPRTQSIWGLVQQVQLGDQTQKRLQELLGRYWPPLKAHLVIKKRLKSDEAEDLLQSFIADKVLRLGLIEKADRRQGRFRSFILTALDRYLIDDRRKRKEAVVSLDEIPSDPPATQEDAATAFHVAWARQVIDAATGLMRENCHSSGRPEIWGVFEQRFLNPILDQVPPASYDKLIAQFNLKSPAQASNLLITGKRMFERSMEAVVSEYEPGDAEIREELEELKKILARAGAGPDASHVS